MIIIITLMKNSRISMKIINTQEMRKMMMIIILLNLKMMIKIQMISINLKKL